MTRPLVESLRYLDAHVLWRAHGAPDGTQRDAGYARIDMDWTDDRGRRRTNYFELDLSPCRYGGLRAYFLCPAEACGRRCVRLYTINGHWLCRQCHGLAYQTQRLHKARRLIYRKHKVLSRVGGVGAGGYPKDKPKGMHERTYYRLWEKADDFEAKAFRHFVLQHGWGEG